MTHDWSVAAVERQTYDDLWTVGPYGNFSSGEQFAPLFAAIAPAPATVLDAGCGTGRGGLALAALGYDVRLCDLTRFGLVADAQTLPFVQACLWHPETLGDPVDYVYCCDVLEHVPSTFAMLVAATLIRLSRRGAFFSITFLPDTYGVWVGKPLHQTIQNYMAWKTQLAELGVVEEARDLIGVGTFLVSAR